MKNIICFISIILLNLFIGCRPKPLIITLPEDPPQVVVFSQLIPDATITVLLTKTISALKFSEDEGDSLSNDLINTLLVSDAEVTVSYDGKVEELFELAPGVYSSLGTPTIAGIDYTLRIETVEGEIITSTNRMLEQVGFHEVMPRLVSETRGGTGRRDTSIRLNYKFEDAPEENWYMINVYKRNNGQIDTTNIDINDFFNQGSNIETQTVLLPDFIFDEQIVEGSFEMEDVSTQDSIVVTLSNINEDYYDFLKLRNSSGNFLSSITREPISYPTNVEGGLGFFNTHFPDVQFFDLTEL